MSMKLLVKFLTVVEIEVDLEMDAAVEGCRLFLTRSARLPSHRKTMV